MTRSENQIGDLTREEMLRYSRHLLIPGIGVEGQLRLKQASVLVIGAGGLGAPVTLYLAAAGVGSIGLADFDTVDISNLQRQILFSASDTGRLKVEAAGERLQALNPHCRIHPYTERLTAQNALQILADYDVIVDGTDNFPTRYLVNDACVLLGKPLIYGSIYRFDGQLSVFHSNGGPCYRCLFPSPPPPDLVPSCAEGGVLGVLPGIIGSLQALETLKLLLQQGSSLSGRLLVFDALAFTFQEFRLRRNPNCPLCAEQPQIRELIDYEAFCNRAAAEGPEVSVVSSAQLRAEIAAGRPPFLLDVREPEEYALGHIGGYLIPRGELTSRLDELNHRDNIVIYCRSGKRSHKAAQILLEAGFTQVRNLQGGLLAWGNDAGNGQ